MAWFLKDRSLPNIPDSQLAEVVKADDEYFVFIPNENFRSTYRLELRTFNYEHVLSILNDLADQGYSSSQILILQQKER